MKKRRREEEEKRRREEEKKRRREEGKKRRSYRERFHYYALGSGIVTYYVVSRRAESPSEAGKRFAHSAEARDR